MAGISRDAYKKAAGIAGDSPELAAAAQKVAANVRAHAAAHAATGDYAASIHVKRDYYKGVGDWLVYSDDERAWAKEFGHVTEHGRFVDGIHAFGKALGQGV